MVLSHNCEMKRQQAIEQAKNIGPEVVAKFTSAAPDDNLNEALESRLKTDQDSAELDSLMKVSTHSITSTIINHALPSGQIKAFPHNNLSLMTTSGAKGSTVNFSQISCLLGQQDLEGRRVPRMISGKTLPSFVPWDPSPRA